MSKAYRKLEDEEETRFALAETEPAPFNHDTSIEADEDENVGNVGPPPDHYRCVCLRVCLWSFPTV
jgi:hypothetical protein